MEDTLGKKETVTSNVITNPVMEGWAEGCNVVGVAEGIMEGESVGDDVIKADCDSTSHSLSIDDSNTSIDASKSSVFVVSTISLTCELMPYSGTIMISTH